MNLNKNINLYISKNIKKNNIDSNYLKITYKKDDNFYLIEGLRNFTSNNLEKEIENSEHQITSIYNKLDSKKTISNTKDLNQNIKVKSSATFGKVNDENIDFLPLIDLIKKIETKHDLSNWSSMKLLAAFSPGSVIFFVVAWALSSGLPSRRLGALLRGLAS